LKELANNGGIDGVNGVTGTVQECFDCNTGKMVNQSYKKESSRIKAQTPLEVLYLDLFGPTQTASYYGQRYKLSIVDDATGYSWKLFMNSKSQCGGLVEIFLNQVERQYGLEVEVLMVDNGTELKNKFFMGMIEKRGIRMVFSTPYSSAQIGLVERSHRVDTEAAITLLSASGLPQKLWCFAIAYSNYCRNRTLTSHNEEKLSPYELLTGKKPELLNLEFGERVIFWNSNPKRKKFDARGLRGRFIGYNENIKGILVWNGSKVLATRSYRKLKGYEEPKVVNELENESDHAIVPIKRRMDIAEDDITDGDAVLLHGQESTGGDLSDGLESTVDDDRKDGTDGVLGDNVVDVSQIIGNEGDDETEGTGGARNSEHVADDPILTRSTKYWDEYLVEPDLNPHAASDISLRNVVETTRSRKPVKYGLQVHHSLMLKL